VTIDEAIPLLYLKGISGNDMSHDERLCVLVVIGATENGEKELITVVGGYIGKAPKAGHAS
jgi:hypothetical protein